MINQLKMSGKHVIAVLQLQSTINKKTNFDKARKLIDLTQTQTTHGNVKMVFLPECFDVMAEKKSDTYEQSESIDGATIEAYKSLAKHHKLWMSLGGFHQKSHVDGKILNTHLIIDDCGVIRSTYDKLHMFDSAGLQESHSTLKGEKVTPPVDTPIGKIGLQICYDLRFAELSISQTRMGADILTFPSAFTLATGKAHWHALLRARAIENQCYVIAAGQVGQHNAKRSSYGHSMVVNPWGKIISECHNDVEDICYAEIDASEIEQCRSRIPVQQHRRTDIPGLVPCVKPSPKSSEEVEDVSGVQETCQIDSTPVYYFSTIALPSNQVFYRTPLSFAFVNIKPILPGHVLVSPLRVVNHFTDLTGDEVRDLFTAAQAVSLAVKRHFKGKALTVSMQDGKEAGQSVPHVHVHVLSRNDNDFPQNDDIYSKLQNHDKNVDVRELRSQEVMKAEAQELRKYFI